METAMVARRFGRQRLAGLVIGLQVAAMLTLGHLILSRLDLASAGAPAAERSAMAAPWEPALGRLDQALGRGDLRGAEHEWVEAYRAAVVSRTWEGMVAVGDAARRLGEAGGRVEAATARARRAYLNALLRARHAASIEGVRRSTTAFASLGDTEAAAEGVRIERRLAGRTGHVEGRASTAASITMAELPAAADAAP